MTPVHQLTDSGEQNALIKWANRDEMARNQTKFFLNPKYSDVTLCAEEKLVPAHKLVLASCSEYFERLFETNLGIDRNVIIFHDVKIVDLIAVLSYVYTGEAQMPITQLESFMRVVNIFQLKEGTGSLCDTLSVGEQTLQQCEQEPSLKISLNSDNLPSNSELDAQSSEAYRPLSFQQTSQEPFRHDEQSSSELHSSNHQKLSYSFVPMIDSNYNAETPIVPGKVKEEEEINPRQDFSLNEDIEIFCGMPLDEIFLREAMSCQQNPFLYEAFNTTDGSPTSDSTEFYEMPFVNDQDMERSQTSMDVSSSLQSPSDLSSADNSTSCNEDKVDYSLFPNSFLPRNVLYRSHRKTSQNISFSTVSCKFCGHLIEGRKSHIKSQLYKHQNYCKSNPKGRSKEPCPICKKQICKSYMKLHLRIHDQRKTTYADENSTANVEKQNFC